MSSETRFRINFQHSNSIFSYNFQDFCKRSFAKFSQIWWLQTNEALFLIFGPRNWWKCQTSLQKCFLGVQKFSFLENFFFRRETKNSKKGFISLWPLPLWTFCKRPFAKILKTLGEDRFQNFVVRRLGKWVFVHCVAKWRDSDL